MNSLKPQSPKISNEDGTPLTDALLELLAWQHKQLDKLEQEILKLKGEATKLGIKTQQDEQVSCREGGDEGDIHVFAEMQPSISLTNFIRCTPPPAAIPDVGFNFSQPIKDNVEETVSGEHGKGVLKIYGPDLEEMHGALEEAKTVLTNVINTIDLGLYHGRRSYRLNWIAQDPGLQRL